MTTTCRDRPGRRLLFVLAVTTAATGWWLHTQSRAESADAELVSVSQAAQASADAAAITALGRLEPHHGIIRVAGPSRPTVVISKLLVEEGDTVDKGQVIAVLDDLASLQGRVARIEAEVKNAQAEFDRFAKLYRQGTAAASNMDVAQMNLNVATANLKSAKADLDLASVRAPISGQVLDIHARSGERVGPNGILELGDTDNMYAVAEVYETDVARVRVGQRATITSPALPEEVHGTVDQISLKIGKQDVLSTDPAARTDARVVEVQIRLDESERVRGFTNLQVDVAITP